MSIRLFMTMMTIVTFSINLWAVDDKHSYWSYEGAEGPAHWGELSKDFSICSAGKQQSPINLGKAGRGTVSTLLFSYHTIPLNLTDNGHTLKVSVAPGNFVFLNGEEYILKQFHYHTPSEHTVKGKHAPMEIHFVHQNEKGEYLVIGVLVEEGAENSEYAKIITHKPVHKNEAIIPKGEVIHLKKLLRHTQEHYEYKGSFTTPPCTQGVKWFVLKTQIALSKEQLDILSKVHPHNNRPVQKLHQRRVYQTQ